MKIAILPTFHFFVFSRVRSFMLAVENFFFVSGNWSKSTEGSQGDEEKFRFPRRRVQNNWYFPFFSSSSAKKKVKVERKKKLKNEGAYKAMRISFVFKCWQIRTATMAKEECEKKKEWKNTRMMRFLIKFFF